jgi:hypothetical protein
MGEDTHRCSRRRLLGKKEENNPENSGRKLWQKDGWIMQSDSGRR